MSRWRPLGLALALLTVAAPALAFVDLDPAAQILDLYAWVPPDAPTTVTLAATFAFGVEPADGPIFPAFDDAVLYVLHVDNDGDCLEDIRYELRFTSAPRFPFSPLYAVGVITDLDGFGPNLEQTYTLTRVDAGGTTVLGTGLRVPPANAGPTTTPDYVSLANQAIHDLGTTRVFAGPRDDPRFVDHSLFDLMTIRPGLPGTTGGGVDSHGGSNVLALCLQVPIVDLTAGGTVPVDPSDPAAVLGIWATTHRQEQTDWEPVPPVHSGPWIQVGRHGMALVDPFILGWGLKGTYHGSTPDTDGSISFIHDFSQLAAVMAGELGLALPPLPRLDLRATYLDGLPGLNQTATGGCDLLRLNVAIPPAGSEHPLGVLGGDNAGFPNGRRPADDAVDVTLRLAGGARAPGFETGPAANLGDGVDANDRPFRPDFPYLATPHSSFAHYHDPEQPGQPVSVAAAHLGVEVSPGAVTLRWSLRIAGGSGHLVLERNSARITPQPLELADGSWVDRPDRAGRYDYMLVWESPGGHRHLLAHEHVQFTPAGLVTLHQNAPNPFNPTTRISFELTRPSAATLTFLDLRGRVVDRVEWPELAAGTHQFVPATGDWASGTYFYVLSAGTQRQSRRMTLLK